MYTPRTSLVRLTGFLELGLELGPEPAGVRGLLTAMGLLGLELDGVWLGEPGVCIRPPRLLITFSEVPELDGPAGVRAGACG